MMNASRKQPETMARTSRISRAVQVQSARYGSARETKIARIASQPQEPVHSPFSPLYIRLNDVTREPLSPFRRALRAIERVLNVTLSIVLLAIAVAVIAAEHSPSINAQIMHLLHVDIRAEIAYLMQLIGQLHW